MSTTTTETRSLGAGGRQLSAVGVGTWALGGPFTFDGRYAGWGEVDDAESIRALHTAIDAGVTLIDTAPTYGTGHSERIVGQALAALPVTVRESVAVATKFGLRIDESRRTGGGNDVRPQAIRAECEASLRRLGLDTVDLYQLHGGAEIVAAARTWWRPVRNCWPKARSGPSAPLRTTPKRWLSSPDQTAAWRYRLR
jgi:aryl-alcohol dehydrogenase-like predicted oxidoreductase